MKAELLTMLLMMVAQHDVVSGRGSLLPCRYDSDCVPEIEYCDLQAASDLHLTEPDQGQTDRQQNTDQQQQQQQQQQLNTNNGELPGLCFAKKELYEICQYNTHCQSGHCFTQTVPGFTLPPDVPLGYGVCVGCTRDSHCDQRSEYCNIPVINHQCTESILYANPPPLRPLQLVRKRVEPRTTPRPPTFVPVFPEFPQFFTLRPVVVTARARTTATTTTTLPPPELQTRVALPEKTFPPGQRVTPPGVHPFIVRDFDPQPSPQPGRRKRDLTSEDHQNKHTSLRRRKRLVLSQFTINGPSMRCTVRQFVGGPCRRSAECRSAACLVEGVCGHSTISLFGGATANTAGLAASGRSSGRLSLRQTNRHGK